MQKVAAWIVALLGVTLLALSVIKQYTPKPLGSVAQGSNYFATSTLNGTATGLYTVFTGVGTIGSITVVSSSAAGGFTIYDAGVVSTTPTTTLAVFPASATGGTYVLDVTALYGLRISVPANFNGHFVTTYRPF